MTQSDSDKKKLSGAPAYFSSMINRIFKILPMRENEEDSLGAYVSSLVREMLGCQRLAPQIGESPEFVTMLSIMEFIADQPDCEFGILRKEVFHAISLCDKIRQSCGGDRT